MRTAILFSLLALAAAAPAVAQETAPQRRAGETDLDWSRRLNEFAAAPGIRFDEIQRRLALLTPADRALARSHAASIVSAHLGCQRREAGRCEEEARLTGRSAGIQQAAAPVAPPPRVLTPEQQEAAMTLRDIQARLGHLPIEAFLVRRTGDPIPYELECRQADAAVRLLGQPYRSPCPTGEQKRVVYAQWGRNSAALERQRAAEIAETQRIESARAAATRAAVANSGSGLVEVRTYDRSGNYTGTRMMTASQAATVGARPQ